MQTSFNFLYLDNVIDYIKKYLSFTQAHLGCRRNGSNEDVAYSGRLRLTDILKWLVILKYN